MSSLKFSPNNRPLIPKRTFSDIENVERNPARILSSIAVQTVDESRPSLPTQTASPRARRNMPGRHPLQAYRTGTNSVTGSTDIRAASPGGQHTRHRVERSRGARDQRCRVPVARR